MIDTETVDLGGLKWCPDGSKIAAWDGVHSGQLSIYSISGSRVGFDSVFGVHNIEWSPSAQIIAVATVGSKVYQLFPSFRNKFESCNIQKFDIQVKIINHLSWQTISTLIHPCKIESACVIYRESPDCQMKC